MAGKLMEWTARIPDLRPYERCVIAYLAFRANIHSKRCWPSIETIAQETGMSPRQVRRSLKALKARDLVAVVDATRFGSNIYELNAEIASPGSGVQTHADQIDLSGNRSLPVRHPPTAHLSKMGVTASPPNKEQKYNKEVEHVKTSEKSLAYASESKTPKPGKAKQTKKPSPPISSTPLAAKADSKLVLAWKSAHEAAGLPVPSVTAQEGRQLAQIAKGKDAIDYQALRDLLIPRIVARWDKFCAWASVMGHVHIKSKAPLPLKPHIGFVLRHRVLALQYAENDGEALKFRDEFVAMSKVAKKQGALPNGIPKPKHWNSKLWHGHAPEKK